MSPRRSSRARSSQQPPAGPNHTNSTTSNNSRPDRDNRAGNLATSPRTASIQRSESADGADSTTRAEQLAPRRSRRNGEEKEPVVKQQAEEEDEDAEADAEAVEEEVTRCICGQAEYPGPSAALRQQQPPNADVLSDDTGNFFVQCDKCGVWQHGGCMGLLDESMLPDEYYCEQCKPQFHKITKSANGTKSSRYLPILETTSARSSPLSSNPEVPRKKESKNKQQSESTKRRATMNSRGAYDEDEMLRRAIEESTRQTGTLGKRTRDDDSVDQKATTKRQRTGSDSSSTVSKHSQSPDPTTEENGGGKNHVSSKSASQRLRGTVARTTKENELRAKQKEQMLSQRAEAANKRAARSERRRGEDSPPPTPDLSPSKAAQAIGKIKADTPPLSRSNNNRKTGRPGPRRGRLGRNQYTKDNGEDGTPARDVSHDVNGTGGSPTGANGGESGRSSKAKTHPARTSLNEMRRRVAAILEFVGHMHTERSGQTQNSSASASSSSKGASTPNGVKEASMLPTASLIRAVEAGLKEASSRDEESGLGLMDHKDFGTMGSQDMMETLTKELVQWQTVYGIYSR
ncbi:Histone deacetylase complex subunit [Exophiala sideris]|nr:Histone deacetylase complex subunit [Exophiala sideris]KAK5182323.1 Histone deacetylase complex subunit [Eurotiomycetes sp. CCFEE 6388]